MSRESYFQSRVARYLRGKGCYVIKTTPGPGVPVGCPDILFLKDGFWGGLEIKASVKARYQPLQKDTIAMLHDMSFCKAVYPENWQEVMLELDELLK